MWGQNLRRSRHHRVVSLAAALLQLATVTWIPVIHPYIHPDAPPPPESNVLADRSDQQQQGPEVEPFCCIICAAGHEFSAAIDQKLPIPDVTCWGTQLHTTQYRPSSDIDIRANAARAPPSR
jgi:hypothetical protein